MATAVLRASLLAFLLIVSVCAGPWDPADERWGPSNAPAGQVPLSDEEGDAANLTFGEADGGAATLTLTELAARLVADTHASAAAGGAEHAANNAAPQRAAPPLGPQGAAAQPPLPSPRPRPSYAYLPAYASYSSWVLRHFGPQTDGGVPILGWVTQPFKLVQQDHAKMPLRFTPATSAQLQAAVVASAAQLTGVPSRRCQALLSSSVRVAFAVRSNFDMDSGQAMLALQEAFGTITGFFPGRIDVILKSPSEVVREASASGPAAPAAPAVVNGSRNSTLRQTAARKMMSEQHPLNPEFPEKRVLQVTFRDLAPSNASTLADVLVSRCSGVPSRCLEDIRAVLRRRVGLKAEEDASLRVSMLARPQTELGLVLAVGLVDSSPNAARTVRERLRRWVQQRDVAEFLEHLTLLAAPFPVTGDDPGLSALLHRPMAAAAVWPGAMKSRGPLVGAIAAAMLAPQLRPWQSQPGWRQPPLLGPDAAHPSGLLGPLLPGHGGSPGDSPAVQKGGEFAALADLEQQAAAAEMLVAEAVKSLESGDSEEQQGAAASDSAGSTSKKDTGKAHKKGSGGGGNSSQLGTAAIVGTAVGAGLVAAAVVSAAVVARHYQRRAAQRRCSSSTSAVHVPKPGPPSPVRTAPQPAVSGDGTAGSGTPRSATRRPPPVYHPKFVAQEAWANALARQHGLPSSEEVLESHQVRLSHSGPLPRSPQRIARSPVRRPAHVAATAQQPANSSGASAAPETPTGSMHLAERGDSVSSAARLAFLDASDAGSDAGGDDRGLEADLEVVVGANGADHVTFEAPQGRPSGWRGLLGPVGRLLPWRGRARGAVSSSGALAGVGTDQAPIVEAATAAAPETAPSPIGGNGAATLAAAAAATTAAQPAAVALATLGNEATAASMQSAESAISGGGGHQAVCMRAVSSSIETSVSSTAATNAASRVDSSASAGGVADMRRAVAAALAVRGTALDSPVARGSRGSPFASNYNFSALS